MKAITGRSNPDERIHSAAVSSSDPPISPTSTTASVAGSSAKRGRMSMKVEPRTGSPPMPTAVVSPYPASERPWITS
jgi:hypothetical protein